MAAACAVCRQPITKQTRFVIAGSEAVHDTCIGRLGESLGNRLRAELVRLRGSFDASQIEVQRLRQEVADLARDAERLRRDLGNERDTSSALRRALGEQDQRLQAESVRIRRDANATIDRVIAERDSARSDAAAARSELALHRALGPSTPAATATTTTSAAKDSRDGSEIRFSLLEFDKP